MKTDTNCVPCRFDGTIADVQKKVDKISDDNEKFKDKITGSVANLTSQLSALKTDLQVGQIKMSSEFREQLNAVCTLLKTQAEQNKTIIEGFAQNSREVGELKESIKGLAGFEKRMEAIESQMEDNVSKVERVYKLRNTLIAIGAALALIFAVAEGVAALKELYILKRDVLSTESGRVTPPLLSPKDE